MKTTIQWEYKYVYHKVNTNDTGIEHILNQYGNEGWELLQVISAGGSDGISAKVHAFVFKRPIIDEEYY